MFKRIRNSRVTKVVVYYLCIMMFLEIAQPMSMYALTSGPTQPEFNSFTPISTSDMVDLTSGDFNYNIPIMDVGGYPINLSYASGSSMDQEASWVGLGWNLNIGEITRQIRGLPDDFKGDPIRFENDLKDNITVGTNVNFNPAVFGFDVPLSLGLGVQYNNYSGVSFKPSVGVSFAISENVNVGFNLSSSVEEGATVSPSVSISPKTITTDCVATTLTGSFGAAISSRKGLENMSMSASAKSCERMFSFNECGEVEKITNDGQGLNQGSIGGSYSFNNQSYTPSKRVAFNNKNFTFNATLGGEIVGGEAQVRLSAFGSFQSIASGYKDRTVGGYGYENTQFKNNNEGVLDFNREKEQTITKNTNALPVTNYTYDLYSIHGQGVSGMFRPYRSQVTYLYNDDVADTSESGQFGVELGLGNLFHGGVNLDVSPSTSRTGRWSTNNYTLPLFNESNSDSNNPLYEQTALKLIGELDVDNEINSVSGIYNNRIHSNNAIRLDIGGGEFNRTLLPTYNVKLGFGPGYDVKPFSSKIKRTNRILRNQIVQKITAKEADGIFVFKNTNAALHHTAGMKVTQPDGTIYYYGKSAYNKTKVEATFDVSKIIANTNTPTENAIRRETGLVNYSSNITGHHTAYSDRYINRVTTPKYAHTFLITSVLSSDYQDIDNIGGPSDDDLGSYTKFDYTKSGDNGYVPDYKYRIPYERNKASYNEGLKTSLKDEKGNYIYGEKEVTYLKTIESKTHIAFIDLEPRKDARGVPDEAGGNESNVGASLMCIKSIRLYSKPEIKATNLGIAAFATDINTNLAVKPIKTAHFEYNYKLCKDAINTFDTTPTEGDGKLTLEKLYFTYRDSNMGKYTPYVFDYGDNNPDYFIKGFDIWGNYKPQAGPLTNSEFPFVEQSLNNANVYTASWILKKVKLPSGGEISITTESDDYKYVQNKKAMQMFKVIGAGNNNTPSNNTSLYSGGGGTSDHKKYLYVEVPETNLTSAQFQQKYLKENLGKAIYFKMLLNMNNKSYGKDFVSGYFEIDQSLIGNMNVVNGKVAIPMKFLRRDGGVVANGQVNPISKAGWGFGRTYLNRAVYSPDGSEMANDFESIVYDLVGSIGAMAEIFTGPNFALEGKGCARTFDPTRSWVRLENPNGHKLGGGLRVKKIELSDNWDVMNSVEGNTVYNELYGQEYKYTLTDEATSESSGVATFEPNASPENPFVEPFYGDDGNYAERIGAPKEVNYVEKPFGESFFPSPKITYSRVSVKNLSKKRDDDGSKIIKKHATGKVVTQHYTSYDFPTIVNYTDLDMEFDPTDNPLFVLLDIYTVNHLTASQGFVIETNDMDGKIRSQEVYPEGQDNPISKVVYKYNVEDGKLNNDLTTIDAKGITSTKTIGVDYDMINDFNESYAVSETYGVNTNLAAFLAAIFPILVPIPLPKYARHENILRTSTTTKVIHKTGILIEKEAYDLGSRVSTKNLAWDANTGQVLLTKTINEFDDQYYSFNYPAYWYYKNMGMASENVGMTGTLTHNSGFYSLTQLTGFPNLKPYFKIGDELIFNNTVSGVTTQVKLWVTGYNGAEDHIQLMNKAGALVTSANQPSDLNFKIVRSGNRNQQMASMASVTSMINPIDLDNDSSTPFNNITDETYKYLNGDPQYRNPKIINASAIEYNQDWLSQCENGLPDHNGFINGEVLANPVNPYLYNIKGNWRPIRSYAYLTGRNNFETDNRRKAGFFTNFNPFYTNHHGNWIIDDSNWTFASKVTMYSPYGVELENKDALHRASSAQYGYNYTLPVAVASNSMYREMGFDGFEDYDPLYYITPDLLKKPHFGFSQSNLGEEKVYVTSAKSHTGNNSIAVRARQSAQFIRKIDGCKDTISNTPAKSKTIKNTKNGK